MIPRIAIAVSGGVDSLVAAWLLKQEGGEVIGIHFGTGYEFGDVRTARRIGEQLDIPVHYLDLRDVFQSAVVDYFTRTYEAGKTPNPCLACNPLIKFGAVLDFAGELGAERLATGHYARVVRGEGGLPRLLRGADLKKDQSYFLAMLNREQLNSACFPLGEMTKKEVKALAEEKGLIPADTKESQDVCFIPKDYGAFLVEQGLSFSPGVIEDVSGKEIGRHQGLHRFTVGQRRGINCPASEPYYVVRIDVARNRLVVGFRKDLFTQSCRVSGLNWIAGTPVEPAAVHVRVRYRHTAVPALFVPDGAEKGTIEFDVPEPAVAPGQGAVFYCGDEVLGGGWIE